jgi:hypothetical protein
VVILVTLLHAFLVHAIIVVGYVDKRRRERGAPSGRS